MPWHEDGARLNDDLFLQGLELMLVGMGTVFVFLTLLVLATTLMSYLVRRFVPASVPRAGTADGGPTAEEVAAISAAVARYREERG